MVDLEAQFEKLEHELKEVNQNSEALKRNYLELTELKHILRKASQFFDEKEEREHYSGQHQHLIQASSILFYFSKTCNIWPCSIQLQLVGFVAMYFALPDVKTVEHYLN